MGLVTKVVMNDLERLGLNAHCEWMEAHFVVERQRRRMMKMMPHGVMWDWSWHGYCVSCLSCS